MKLATEPSEEVTVTVSGHINTDLTLDETTLTFTTANWNTAQTVTVKAADDADGTDDAVTLAHAASGGNYEDVSAELKVTVTDDDRGIVFTPTSLTVEEGDATGETYTVKLATEPSEEVTVTVSGHINTDLTLDETTLTFTTANWNTAQTVTVKAADDADGTDDAVTLAHAASGGNYEDVSAELKVTVTDDDRGIVFTPTSLTVEEGDATGETYTVKLATEPSEEVTVTVSGQAGTDLTLSGLSPTNTLTFTATNWDTAQMVTVKAADDEDGADDTVTLAHAASGGNYEDVSAELKVTVTDDDRGIVFTPTSLTVEEGDATGETYTVKLATEPSEEVTVTVSGQAGTDLTLSGLSPTNTLTFTATNWDTAQMVTVKAADDEDGADDTVTLAHAASGGNYEDVSAELKVTVTDDDRGIVFTPTSLTVEEGDATGETYTVKLATEPSEEVTVTVSGQAGTDLTLSGLSPTNTLTFTATNWDTAQMVTVKAADDEDGADDTVTLAHAATGGDYAGVSAELKVTVTDDDRAIVFTPTSLTVEEGDTTGASLRGEAVHRTVGGRHRHRERPRFHRSHGRRLERREHPHLHDRQLGHRPDGHGQGGRRRGRRGRHGHPGPRRHGRRLRRRVGGAEGDRYRRRPRHRLHAHLPHRGGRRHDRCLLRGEAVHRTVGGRHRHRERPRFHRSHGQRPEPDEHPDLHRDQLGHRADGHRQGGRRRGRRGRHGHPGPRRHGRRLRRRVGGAEGDRHRRRPGHRLHPHLPHRGRGGHHRCLLHGEAVH